MKVTALVVTFNRMKLLQECLSAIEIQTTPVDHLIVIDNHSSDGTKEFLDGFADDKLDVVHMSQNLGGSAGFYRGMEEFIASNNDELLWLMDDDTIPEPDTLQKLLVASHNIYDFGFLASNVRWIDGSPALMNIPVVDPLDWNQNASGEDFYPVIKSASFVSLMLPRTVIQQVGLPYKEFFIWGDDAEYTSRISQQYTSYFVPDSVVIHKMKQNTGVDIVTDDSNRLDRYFYSFRNRMFLARQHHGKLRLKSYAGMSWELVRVACGRKVKKRGKKLKVITRGMVSGRFFNPKITYLHRN
ncbi:glycosyltransferase family 2 protein [Companilactobacillus jidongensis]|uniref:glycosyltransferase family 2 protein n=1 Tax=Companilactobacillus jidongensis TaxID=2486006 RepID=UPI000F769A8A|nr:glycosyltransferase family 2 protein [Companilactobacillus jidongensis]